VDGVYGRFYRPSLFRLMNRNFRFQSTPWGGNLHCASIPQEMLHCSAKTEIGLLHYGYLDRDLRLRKYEWYNRVDPNNYAEDCYRHMVQGDIPEVPPSMKLRHAGPLQFESLSA
jgi:hypothetical protein